MAYDKKLLARARAELENIRSSNQLEAQQRLALAYRRVPELKEIDDRMRGQMTELVRLTISRAPDIKERIEKLEDENLTLQQKRAELLCANGWGMDYLDEIYSCPLCHDTGKYKGEICSCLKKLYNRELTKELGGLIKRGDECFESFDLNLYSDRPDPQYNVIPREKMAKVYEICRRFAESFPDVNSNLILQGAPGLGKTYLSACIARVVADKGYSVCYDSAVSALDAFEQKKFCRDTPEGEAAARRVHRMLECDLMILDDLGTEMITAMSTSALYTLLNTRLVNGKKIIISTNCSDEDLERKYTPQICSRIAGDFLHLPFAGQDIRLILKGV
ncbi:MAG: ATP-binding protein [Candidatus Limivicinus sp.]|jgi:DNA replication protein DnaC